MSQEPPYSLALSQSGLLHPVALLGVKFSRPRRIFRCAGIIPVT